MKDKKGIYILMFLPLILTTIALLFLPDQVAIRYSSTGIQYGSKFALVFLPIFSIWIGGFLILIAKTVSNTSQEKAVRKITYIPLIIFNLVTMGALTGAFLLAVYASFTARGKGPIISNPYLWMSEEERAKVDKKAEYRQLTIVFGCLALAFAMLAVYVITSWKWSYVMMWIVFAFVVIYAVVSSICGEIKK